MVQEGPKRRLRKWIISQRPSKVLVLSSKSLVFLSHQTTHIKVRQADYHNTLTLMVLPNPLYEMIIMLYILLGGTRSKWANLNSLCYSPKVKGLYKKKWSIILSLSMHNKQTSRLRTLYSLLIYGMSLVFTF